MPSQIAKYRLNAFQKQTGRCYYCGSPMWIENQKDFAAQHGVPLSKVAKLQCTAEHLVARCDGGRNSQNNIVAACLFCNSLRHRMKNPPDPANYKIHVKKLLSKGSWHSKSLRHLHP